MKVQPMIERLHTITIVIGRDGSVMGDLDDEVPLWPIGTESTAESTIIDGQAHSIVDQACAAILRRDLAAMLERQCEFAAPGFTRCMLSAGHGGDHACGIPERSP